MQADLACITETWLDGAGGVTLTVCPPGVPVQQQVRPGRQGVGVGLVYLDTIPLTRCHIPQFVGFEYVYLKVGAQDRIEILLVYCTLCYSTFSLPKLPYS